MFTRRILLSALAAIVYCAVLMAVPAKPQPCVFTQSDGTTVTLVMGGGELHRSLMTLDGMTVARNDKGDYCYVAGGSLSDVVAHDKDSRSIEEVAFVAAYRDQMMLGTARQRAPRRDEANDNPQVPTIGSPRIPVILVSYTDIPFYSDDPKATFQIQFNEKDKSCLHYFQSQSRGAFSPQFDILGPVELPNNRAFYGANVRIYGTEVDTQLGTMIYDACTGLDDVDFSRYDNDNDSIVDVVVVLYAGVGEAQAWQRVPESVWPCQWDMQEAYDWNCSVTGPFQLDGVTINKFAVFNELEGSNNLSTNIDGIGTFCHEFSHCLGLPDFYPTNNGRAYGMSNWSLMDHGCYLDGGDTPAGYSSYERHYMGWMDLIDPVENTQYTLAPLNSDQGTAVKVVNDANPDEYYLLEYRTQTGWDAFLPGEGILILHVDYDKEAWVNNTPNNNSGHQRMTIIPADNILSGANNSTDTWPLGGLDSLTNYSTPAARVFTGGYMNKPIRAMAVDASSGTASLMYMPVPPRPNGDVNGDGEVTIADVSELIEVILSGDQDEASETADVNRDGEVNIGDINAVIDLILGYGL